MLPARRYCVRMLQGYKDGEVAILTPYVGQLRLIRREVEKFMTAAVNDRDAQDLAQLAEVLRL